MGEEAATGSNSEEIGTRSRELYGAGKAEGGMICSWRDREKEVI